MRVEVDTVSAQRWAELSRDFSDANIYQTWPYEAAVHPHCKVSRLVVYDGHDVIALAQASIARLPLLGSGIAYFQSAPVWQLRGAEPQVSHLHACLDAISCEYMRKRRLLVRIIPRLTTSEEALVTPAFEGAKFRRRHDGPQRRTIVVDLRMSLEQLRKGMHGKWRNCLNSALARGDEVRLGEGDDDFKHFVRIYKEMLARKQFQTTTDVNAFRLLQGNLTGKEKMKVILCGSRDNWHTGAVVSTIGERGVYLFGATAGDGLKNHSSYLVQWRAIELLKEEGCLEYDLNGINPETNPSTYRFKARLAGVNGRELTRLGTFDGCLSPPSRMAVEIGSRVADRLRALKAKLGKASAR